MLNIVVIGSGVMGSGIAAHIANCKNQVHLLDIVPEHTQNRNILSLQAIEKLTSSLEDRITNIKPGNLEDNIDAISQADWIIEVIVENLELKQKLYNKIENICKKDAIITSNTSTIPLKNLIRGMNQRFKEHFFITHFFNPPQYMPLLELIISNYNKQDTTDKICNFLDINLGKIIVKSNDTPGFIANRIGCYWLECGLQTAIKLNITVQEADALISTPFGIPSTGIFGLFDLIGIDVMELIAKSLASSLKKEDNFLSLYKQIPLIQKMITNGFIGRKGKGGFYRVIKDKNNNKIKEALNLTTGEYNILSNFVAPSLNLRDLFAENEFLKILLAKTLSYAASLVPEISNNISDIDKAMRLGYNWKYGPFELIDLIGNELLIKILQELNIKIPNILTKLGVNKFYQNNKYFTGEKYQNIPRAKGIIYLNDFNKIICQNNSAIVRDTGDKIAAIEITNKMGVLNHEVFTLILNFFTEHSANFKGAIIANQQRNFSVGGDLKFMLQMAESKNFKAIDEYLQLGQKTMLAIKYSSIPLISALKGMALGGGYEILLHSAGIVTHIGASVGLVETGVGIIPAWGGCKELILNTQNKEERLEAFKNILYGKTSNSAHNLGYKLIPNTERVLAEAKNLCIKEAENYQIQTIKEGTKLDINWHEEIEKMNLKDYDKIIAKNLALIFSLNNLKEDNIMNKEREIFINLLQNTPTLDRIRYMLQTGKRLIN